MGWDWITDGAQSPAFQSTLAAVNAALPFVNVLTHGAVGNDSTDNAAAITAALAALPANGGTLYFPKGSYRFSSFPSLDGLRSVVIKGDGGLSGGAGSGSRLIYTGTGSGSVISARSTQGIQFHDIEIRHNDAAFTGTLLDFSATGTKGSATGRGTDTTSFVFSRCRISGQRTAILLDLDRAILGDFYSCIFYQGLIGVKGATSTSTYSNAMTFHGGTFLGSVTCHVQNAQRGWTFLGCTFEQLFDAGGSNAGAGALAYGNSVQGIAVTFIGGYMGDANATGTWISFNGSGLTVKGMTISTGASGVTTSASDFGIEITGNLFESMTTGVVFGATNRDVTYAGNDFATVTNKWTGTQPTSAYRIHSNSGNNMVTSDAPTCRVTHSANQTIADVTITYLAFDTEMFDNDTIHASGSNTRLTCRTPGKYLIGASIKWSANAAGTFRYIELRLNGATRLKTVSANPNAGSQRHEITELWDLAVGDYVELGVQQNTGGNLDVQTGTATGEAPAFWMALIA